MNSLEIAMKVLKAEANLNYLQSLIQEYKWRNPKYPTPKDLSRLEYLECESKSMKRILEELKERALDQLLIEARNTVNSVYEIQKIDMYKD